MQRSALTITFLMGLLPMTAQAQHEKQTALPIPASVRAEHEEIHKQLTAATRLPGQTGVLARRLAQVLHPHFEREEQIALPPLALLGPLARNETEPAMPHALAMSDSLRAELPSMLREHKTIAAATQALGKMARKERQTAAASLADNLLQHARSEEEIFYPAAVLVGQVIRSRTSARSGTQ